MEKRPSKAHVPILDIQDKTDGEAGTIKWVMPNHKAINLKYNSKRYKDVEEVVDEKPEKNEVQETPKEDKKEEPINDIPVIETEGPKYIDMSLDQLRTIAKDLGIKGYSRMKKDTLIKRLK